MFPIQVNISVHPVELFFEVLYVIKTRFVFAVNVGRN